MRIKSSPLPNSPYISYTYTLPKLTIPPQPSFEAMVNFVAIRNERWDLAGAMYKNMNMNKINYERMSEK